MKKFSNKKQLLLGLPKLSYSLYSVAQDSIYVTLTLVTIMTSPSNHINLTADAFITHITKSAILQHKNGPYLLLQFINFQASCQNIKSNLHLRS